MLKRSTKFPEADIRGCTKYIALFFALGFSDHYTCPGLSPCHCIAVVLSSYFYQ